MSRTGAPAGAELAKCGRAILLHQTSSAKPSAQSGCAIASRISRSRPLSVARLLEEGIEDCLACLAFPLAHRARIRTTNGLERLHEEIKRRTRVVRIFPNSEACIRLVTALCIEQSEEWVSGRRYLEMSEL
jgi:transposase-like protein